VPTDTLVDHFGGKFYRLRSTTDSVKVLKDKWSVEICHENWLCKR